MSIFRPTASFDGITDISAEYLISLGVKAVLLDIDNTVVSYASHKPINGAVEWVKNILARGISAVIVSNNVKKRVEPIAKIFSLPYITFALKPLPFGYIKASRRLKLRCRECVIIGDQIFTDVVGANLCGMRSLLLKPIEPEMNTAQRIKRMLEKPLRKRF